MDSLFPAVRRRAAAGLLGVALLSALVFYPIAGHVQGEALAYQGTDYPPPEDTLPPDDSYPAPVTGTPGTATITRTPTQTQPGDLSTPLATMTGPVRTVGTSGPNQFLTEDAQMGNSRVTPPADQTFGPTRTPTITRTPTMTITITHTPDPSLSPMVTPDGKDRNQGSGIDWTVVGAGFLLPLVLLSFGYLGIAIWREAQKG